MRSKKLLKLTIGVILVAVMAISIPLMGGCAAPAPAPTPTPEPGVTPSPTPTPEPAQVTEPIKWRFQSYAGAPLTAEIFTPYIEQLERASGGRIEVEIYTADELVPTSELIPALRDGTIDITCNVDQLISAPIDVIDIGSCLPFGSEEGLEIECLWQQRGLHEIWEEAYDEVEGVTFLSMGSWDPTCFITKEPIYTFEDLRGLKVQTFGPAMAQVLGEAGVTCMTLPWEDTLMSIQTGVLDGLVTCGATEAYTCGYKDVASCFLTNPVGRWALDWVVSTESWEALPPDLQELWMLAIDSAQYRKTVWYYWGESYYRVVGEELTITTLPAEDWAKLEVYKEAYYDELAAKSPRCARAIQIIRDYQAELEAAGYPYR